MKQTNIIKISALLISLTANSCAIASGHNNTFHSFGSIDELLALPKSKLCVDGGPSSDDIKLILLNGTLTSSMFQNDPAMARMMINEQSINIKTRIREKCSAKPNVSSRELTKEMLRNENDTCKQGAPTKDELTTYLKEQNATDIDKQLQTIPYEYRLIMEEGAKLKGLTLREAFIEDAAAQASQNWEKACANKSPFENKLKNFTDHHNKLTPQLNIEEQYRIADKKLNDTWRDLPSETRKTLLPSQRKWIKQQAICKQDTECLIEMINKRITELESKNGK
ncbi:lysozyme inhibitor LprI family protein [Leclercia adecarboxylata]|uniref:lysozyme inhibitor LprI family protein n=1 Tax=Leclercia adecarboxylata TaxID=83655 RepID=UPI00124D1236|nr:lysozyme inhibitor LprI family protein [Leclercia adecarboxylata]QFH49022.1 DUF1311 domain-containing protein [Leclercia adecarboxylata]